MCGAIWEGGEGGGSRLAEGGGEGEGDREEEVDEERGRGYEVGG